MQICPSCQHENSDETNACSACGKPLSSLGSGVSNSGENPIGDIVGEIIDTTLDLASSAVDGACTLGSSALECTGEVLGAVAEGAGVVASGIAEVIGSIADGL